MSFRIGDIAGTPSTLMLPFALAFFLAVSWPRLFPGLAPTKPRAWLVLSVGAVGGILGAVAHSRVAAPVGSADALAWLDLRFGSLGAFWGVLISVAAFALVTRRPALAFADALTPGLIAGASVARIGCLFTGCCRGIHIESGFWANIQPFRPWPLYDMAALLLTLAILSRTQRRPKAPGVTVAFFLLVYSPMRFAIEFARDLDVSTASLTSGQVMCIIQLVAGGLILASIRTPRDASPPQ